MAGSLENLVPTNLAADYNPNADWKNMRRFRAELPDWSLATVLSAGLLSESLTSPLSTVPLLTDLCLEHLISNFALNASVLAKLNAKHRRYVLDRLDPKLPISITAKLIDDEMFWKRVCKSKWEVVDSVDYGGNYRRMFFERRLQEVIESYEPNFTDPVELTELLELGAQHVRRLDIRQLLPPISDGTKIVEQDIVSDTGSDAEDDGPEQDHFDFSPVFVETKQLEEFSVTYGVRECSMNFQWNLFLFTNQDCLSLSKTIAACPTLRKIEIHRSKVDDENPKSTRSRVLIAHLMEHPNLEELNLSHNLIGDRGARAVGKLISSHKKLHNVNLCNNQIKEKGAMAIAHALTKNDKLTELNLRLNKLADEGGQAICKALLKNTTLIKLNMASNELSEGTASGFSQVLVHNKTLIFADLSVNRFGIDGGKQLQEGMEENHYIIQLDLRLTEVGQESEFAINQCLHKNRERHRLSQLKAVEKITDRPFQKQGISTQ